MELSRPGGKEKYRGLELFGNTEVVETVTPPSEVPKHKGLCKELSTLIHMYMAIAGDFKLE